jgi:hypothetical protein
LLNITGANRNRTQYSASNTFSMNHLSIATRPYTPYLMEESPLQISNAAAI